MKKENEKPNTKATKKKKPKSSNQDNLREFLAEDIGSIKIPNLIQEKIDLLSKLRLGISEIDGIVKQMNTRREYYLENVELLEKEIALENRLLGDNIFTGGNCNLIENFKSSLINNNFEFSANFEVESENENIGLKLRSFTQNLTKSI